MQETVSLLTVRFGGVVTRQSAGAQLVLPSTPVPASFSGHIPVVGCEPHWT